MSLSITPNIAFTPSIFYDVNHNPLNIPCEGPKVVPFLFIVDTNSPDYSDGIYDVNFNQLMTNGQMTCVQAMTINFFDGSRQDGTAIITIGGSGQVIGVGNNSGVSTVSIPLCCLNPALIRFDLHDFAKSNASPIQVQIYNYMHPSFNSFVTTGA